MRNFKKIKTLDDYAVTDAPVYIPANLPAAFPQNQQMILRMLVRPKYGDWKIPSELDWLKDNIFEFAKIDAKITGITDSWCYVTVRHGPVISVTDDEWHFDGASFRTDIVPERNYIFVSSHAPQYKVGKISWHPEFDPTKHDLFDYATKALEAQPILTALANSWMLMSPFCFHRRDPQTSGLNWRSFIRISFPDIEGRDINNTHNPLLPTPFWGRDPVNSFRAKLQKFGGSSC